MPVHFVDREGHHGWIDDDLSVSYTGAEDVAALIERYLDERATGVTENGAGPADDDLQELMLELYEDGTIWKIERVDDDGPHDVG